MNLSSIVLILQMALGLLSNPNLAANPTLKAQALNFASQAIAIADSELQQSVATQSITTTATPPPSYSAPANQSTPVTQSTSTSATTTQSAASVPSGYSIQLISFPGGVVASEGAGARSYITNPTSTIDRPGAVEAPDNAYVSLGAELLNPSGQAVSDAVMTVTTDDPNQNATINGTGNVLGNPAVAYYPYSYAFKTVGTHTITFSAMGVTTSITLTSQ